jgi:hypothetical protein
MADASTRKRTRKAEGEEREEEEEEWEWDFETFSRGVVRAMLADIEVVLLSANEVRDLLGRLDHIPEAVLFLNTKAVDEVTRFLTEHAEEDARDGLRSRVEDALVRVREARKMLNQLYDESGWSAVTVRSPIEPLRIPKYTFLKIAPPGGARMVTMVLPDWIMDDEEPEDEDANAVLSSSELGIILRHLACAMLPHLAADDADTMNMSTITDRSANKFKDPMWRDLRSVTTLLEDWRDEWRCRKATCIELTLGEENVVYER